MDELHRWQSRRVDAWGRLLLALTGLVMVAVLGRVVQLKVVPDPRMEPAAGTAFSSRPHFGRRGDLLDRRGRVIATSSLGYRLFVDPDLVDDLQTVAVDIAGRIGGDPTEIDRKILVRPGRRYVVIEPLLAEWQVDAILGAPLRGVCLEPRLVRHYHNGDIAAAIVGRVGFEHTGLSGMEHRFNGDLQPRRGHLTYLRDSGRRPLWIEPAGYEPGADGGDVRLSIDLVIQEIVESRLRQAVHEQNAGGGRMVVLDPTTGEILALCDVLNHRPGWTQQAEDPLRSIHPALGRNRCVTDPYEPGSTFKPFVWSVATELGRVTPDELLPTPTGGGYRTSYGRLIRDTHYYGPSTWRKVLIKSMNSGMAIVAERMRHREMRQVLTRFGFGERTGCGIPGEASGIVTPPERWSQYTQSSVSFGHEVAVTPVQMARAFSAFARDGTIPRVRLTAVTEEDRGYRFIRRAITPAMARRTREVLRDVFTEGTGRAAQSEKYMLFGKSGTPQLPNQEGGYFEDRYVPSFIAAAPFEEPRIVVLCVLDDPDKKKGHYGGAIAGPVVRDVIDATLEYLGVPPDKEPEPSLAMGSDLH